MVSVYCICVLHSLHRNLWSLNPILRSWWVGPSAPKGRLFIYHWMRALSPRLFTVCQAQFMTPFFITQYSPFNCSTPARSPAHQAKLKSSSSPLLCFSPRLHPKPRVCPKNESMTYISPVTAFSMRYSRFSYNHADGCSCESIY